jgi:hypothetical protein
VSGGVTWSPSTSSSAPLSSTRLTRFVPGIGAMDWRPPLSGYRLGQLPRVIERSLSSVHPAKSAGAITGKARVRRDGGGGRGGETDGGALGVASTECAPFGATVGSVIATAGARAGTASGATGGGGSAAQQ